MGWKAKLAGNKHFLFRLVLQLLLQFHFLLQISVTTTKKKTKQIILFQQQTNGVDSRLCCNVFESIVLCKP